MIYFRIFCKGYWNFSNEEDKRFNFLNFIDIIGLDDQLFNLEKVGIVNSWMINLFINGILLENCDFLDLGKKLKEEMKIESSLEVEFFVVDIIVVVILLKNDIILYVVFKEIFKEVNFRIRSKLYILICMS